MRQCRFFPPAFILILLFCQVFFAWGQDENPRVFRIGTGGKTGVYYPVGKLIAEGLTRQCPGHSFSSWQIKTGNSGFIAVAQNSAGSVENVATILCGETEAGLVQADVASQAHDSSGLFQGNPESRELRAVASLYSEKFQIVVRRDAGIRRIQDLRDKRISLDEQGSGTLSVMRIILQACKMTEKDFRPVYLKPVFTKTKMISGELQGFVMMAGLPMDAVLDLALIPISLIPVPEDIAREINLRHPHLVPGVIPANIYPDVPETPTVQVYALLVVRADTDPDLIYGITAALWSEPVNLILRQGHPQAREITLDTALKGLTIPLHKGAERFYREVGMLDRGKPAP